MRHSYYRIWNVRVWEKLPCGSRGDSPIGETKVETVYKSPVRETADEAKRLGVERLGHSGNPDIYVTAHAIGKRRAY